MILTSLNPVIKLDIEEIPPTEVFYSPKHKLILKKRKKKRKVAKT